MAKYFLNSALSLILYQAMTVKQYAYKKHNNKLLSRTFEKKLIVAYLAASDRPKFQRRAKLDDKIINSVVMSCPNWHRHRTGYSQSPV